MEQSSNNEPVPMTEVPESEFRVPTSDDHGHNTPIKIRIHPGMATEVHRILESNWFPYTSTPQIYRHAIKRHLEWLATLAPIPNSVLRRTNAIMELIYEEEEQEKFMDILDGMARRVGMLLGEGLVGEAKEFVNRTYMEIEQMPQCLWKKRFISKMDEKYGYLLNEQHKKEVSKVIASLLDLGDEE